MRMMMLAGTAVAALALSACGGGATEGNSVNATGTDNGMMDPMSDPNMMMDQNGAMNAAGSAGGAGGANGAVDANTQNAMQRDMNTNDPDTNLANGM
jgi:hypothetical protein